MRSLRYRLNISRKSLPILFGVTTIITVLSLGYFLPLPFDPNLPHVGESWAPPSLTHLFGTDVIGRDIFSRVIDASSRDIPLSLAGTAIALVIGAPIGLLLSSDRKSSDIGMRILDAIQTFPLLILSIAIVTLTGNHLINVVYAIALVNAPRFIRLVRAEALALRQMRFIEAATSIGAPGWRILFKHLLPNTWGIIIAQCSLAAAQAIIIIASLNFIGVGSTPPNATWGSMLQGGVTDALGGIWWPPTFPAIFIVVTVLSFNLIADSLRDSK